MIWPFLNWSFEPVWTYLRRMWTMCTTKQSIGRNGVWAILQWCHAFSLLENSQKEELFGFWIKELLVHLTPQTSYQFLSNSLFCSSRIVYTTTDQAQGNDSTNQPITFFSNGNFFFSLRTKLQRTKLQSYCKTSWTL